jgi:hypothetical protein
MCYSGVDVNVFVFVIFCFRVVADSGGAGVGVD